MCVSVYIRICGDIYIYNVYVMHISMFMLYIYIYICIHRKHKDTLSIKTACLNEWIKKMWDTHIHTHTQWNTTQPCKGQNNVICSSVDGPIGDHTKWSKPDQERQIPYDITRCEEHKIWYIVVVVQGLSCVWLLDFDTHATPWTVACQAPLSSTVSWSLLKLMSIESALRFYNLILCCPLLLSIFPSTRVFSNESVLPIRWPTYWSFSISPSNEYWGLISFRIDASKSETGNDCSCFFFCFFFVF